MDVLSDALRVIRLSGSIFFTARFSSPWAIESPPPEDLGRVLNSQSGCVTLFHILVDGRCLVTVNPELSFQMEPGDVVIFPHGEPHIMASEKAAPPKPLSSILRPGADSMPRLEYGGGGDCSRFICGYLQCDQQFNPLMGSLPQILWLQVGRGSSQTDATTAGTLPGWSIMPVREADWLDVTLRQTIQEATGERSGGSAMLPRLTELMYLEVLRRYTQQLPPEHAGWLAGVRDPVVGRVLRLMHAHPERLWTVEDLAREAAISRSALAQRFTDLIGEPPMQYLTAWRIQLARYLLSQTALSLAEIKDRVGYQSEEAFNRAFKRHTGQPPATWRRQAS